MSYFAAFPKIPRLSGEMVITEKLDGLNASVWIERAHGPAYAAAAHQVVARVDDGHPGGPWLLRAAYRNHFITSGHATFGAWVRDNAEELVELGEGVHCGEWWGEGIKRGYGLHEKRFSLFDVGRWRHARWFHETLDRPLQEPPACCDVVPVVHVGTFDTADVVSAMNALQEMGSLAAPGFMRPEGVVIRHTAAGQYFKKTFEEDA